MTIEKADGESSKMSQKSKTSIIEQIEKVAEINVKTESEIEVVDLNDENADERFREESPIERDRKSTPWGQADTDRIIREDLDKAES